MFDTNGSHLKIFEEECRIWIKFFGLLDWMISFDHEKLDEIRATVTFDVVARQATFCLSTDWDREPKDWLIQKTAFHEVCELRYAKIESMLNDRVSYKSDNVEEEIHSLIRVLENQIFPYREIILKEMQ